MAKPKTTMSLKNWKTLVTQDFADLPDDHNIHIPLGDLRDILEEPKIVGSVSKLVATFEEAHEQYLWRGVSPPEDEAETIERYELAKRTLIAWMVANTRQT